MNADKQNRSALHLRASAFICGFILVFGCAPKRPPGATTRPMYTGPTEPMADVVAAINANNAKLPTLWASMKSMEASIVDDKGKRHDEVFRGNVLYRAPGEVRVDGVKDPIGSVLTIGSSRDLYWLSVKVGPDTAWWGRYKYFGSPCAQPIPIRPDLVLQVLGVGMIGTNFKQLPAPVMRFNPDADAYMFVWVGELQDRFVATREIWYDRATKRPTRVALFDENGRTVMSAFLSGHVRVNVPNTPENDRPMVAGEYRLYFPESGSRLRITLDDVRLSRAGAPSDRTFSFDPKTAGTAKVIQLDEACGP